MLTIGGMKYRVCAYMGLSGMMPENTMPSFAAAVSLGVDEISFDVRLSRDGKLVVARDPDIGKVSDKHGLVREYDLETLLGINAGSYKGWYVQFCTPEMIIENFGGRVGMNIHIREVGKDGYTVRELYRLLKYHNALDGVYFTARANALAACYNIAQRVPRCSMDVSSSSAVDYGIKYACKWVEFVKPHFSSENIARAKRSGMKCIGCWADDNYEARRMLDAGIDTIMTTRPDVLSMMKVQN